MNKQQSAPSSVDEYIQMFPENVRDRLNELRATIRKAAPEAVEIISYEMPTFKLHNRPLVYFGAFKTHIGFYPFPSGVEMFKRESSEYITSKGTIQFSIDKPLPLKLIKKVVEYRIKENAEKQKKNP